MKNNKILLIFIIIIAVLILWIGKTFYDAYQTQPFILQGEIDAQEYMISSEVGGRVKDLAVRKGDTVSIGEYVYTISSPQLDAKVEQAKAAAAAATEVKDAVNIGSRKQEIKTAYANYQSSQSASALAKKTYERIEELYKDGVVPQQKRDEAYTAYQVAKNTENAAYQQYNLIKQGAREQTKKASVDTQKVFEGKVAQVEAYVDESKQYARHNGYVTNVLLHDGELAAQGFPVVLITDMNDSWAKFHVREDLLHHFKMGKEFMIKMPAFQNKKFPFKVSYIDVMGEYATWKAAQAGKGFDLRSFEVELRPVKPIEGLRSGMSTIIEFNE